MSNEKKASENHQGYAPLAGVSGGADLMIKHCEKCNELTPQIDNNTTGMCCQVCMHSNPYAIENAAAKATPEWLAAFWQQKYYQVAGFNGANNVVVTLGKHCH